VTDCARRLIGVDAVNEGAERWTGKGEVVAVIDSGIDKTHPDLEGCVDFFEARPEATSTDRVGHGTHVSGTIAGRGVASKGKVRGMAPEARLVGLGIVKADEKSFDLPPDLGDLLCTVATQGAKIINLSWRIAKGSVYEGGSMAVDCFAREHPEVLVVVAAGNDGMAPQGWPTFFSIGAPATAKNVLTVGACLSDRKEFGDVTWGRFGNFPEPPARDEPLVGDPGKLAADSSRGPTDTDSVKPDVLAPGTAILAPRAADLPDGHFWRTCAKYENRYAYMLGTSMATPVVSGAAAILRQYLREERGTPNPSSALLRALLIASAVRVPWAGQAQYEVLCGYPDFNQGFGRIDLRALLPHPRTPKGYRASFRDIPDEDPEAVERGAPVGSKYKAAHSYRVTVPAGAKQPLRIVLAWSDRSVRGLQNQLKLDVTGPGGLRRRGNDEHTWRQPPQELIDPAQADLRSDNRNNAQQVVVDEPATGSYRIRVVGANTLFPPQGFALCACGEMEGELEREA
jgi:serine protease AprX